MVQTAWPLGWLLECRRGLSTGLGNGLRLHRALDFVPRPFRTRPTLHHFRGELAFRMWSGGTDDFPRGGSLHIFSPYSNKAPIRLHAGGARGGALVDNEG